MATFMHCLVALALCATPSIAGSSVAVNGLDSNANPIRRVVSMLQSMAAKVEKEAAAEEELYEKFMCYCKTGAGDLQASIASSTAKVPQVQSDIEEAEQTVVMLAQELKSHQEDRAAAKAAMAAATSQREEEHKKFVEEETEYKGYLSALGQAIPAIMKGMAGTFLQTATNAHLRQALTSDSTITDYDRTMVMSFLTGTSDDGYVPKSNEVVGILQQMEDDFKKTLAEVTKAEEEAVKIYDELMTAKTKQVETLTESIEKKILRTGDLKVSIAQMKNELTEEEAALVEDQKFLADLDKDCESKKAERDERVKTRGEELVAIHETIKILNDDDALELFKKTLPSASSFLQVATKTEVLRQKALAVLHRLPKATRANHPELDFMALALSGKKVDFSKVIRMIDNMIKLLKQEQADDDAKKEYCTQSIDTAEDKVKVLDKKIEDLEASIAEKEEAISTLTSEIKDISAGIKQLDSSVMEATEQRKEEHEEYMELMSSDSAAKELLGFAKNRLNKFYNPQLYKAPPKRELSEQEKIYSDFGGELEATPAPGGIANTGVLAFAQVFSHTHKRDAPPPPPEMYGAYQKKTEESSGVIGMIDLLIRDLDKEMTEAETQEKDAQKEYESMMDDAAKKRAADLKSIAAKETAKAEAEDGKTTETATKDAESKELQATVKFEMQLHQECDWLMQNYDLRVEARAQEADSLKEAKAILSGADFSFVQSKPEAEVAIVRHLRG